MQHQVHLRQLEDRVRQVHPAVRMIVQELVPAVDQERLVVALAQERLVVGLAQERLVVATAPEVIEPQVERVERAELEQESERLLVSQVQLPELVPAHLCAPMELPAVREHLSGRVEHSQSSRMRRHHQLEQSARQRAGAAA
jgi:hypothetical protein